MHPSRASRWRRPDRIVAAINATKLSSEGTRYAPALKLASQIISASTLPRREVVLISDFQKIGWANRNEINFPQGTTITPVDLGGAAASDVAVSQVTTSRDSTGDRDHVTVAARLVNTGAAPKTVSATLAIGGRDVQTKQVSVAARGARAGGIHVDRRAERRDEGRRAHHAGFADAGRRTEFHDRAGRGGAGARRRAGESARRIRACSSAARWRSAIARRFASMRRPINALTPRDFDGRALVILDEVDPPGGAVGARLRAMIDGGGGVVFVPGNSRPESWSQEWRAVLPATIGGIVDRTGDAGGTLSSIDYAHPIFELFNAPRSGDFSTAKFYRYRTLTPVDRCERVGALRRRFAGARRTGRRATARCSSGRRPSIRTGRTCRCSRCFCRSSINSESTPVATPIRVRGSSPATSSICRATASSRRRSRADVPPTARASFACRRRRGRANVSRRPAPNHLATLREQGFYELGGRDTPVGSGRPIAVNVDPAESDLSHLDPQDIVVAVTSVDGQRQPGSDLGTRDAAGSGRSAEDLVVSLARCVVVDGRRDRDVESAVARFVELTTEATRRRGRNGKHSRASVGAVATPRRRARRTEPLSRQTRAARRGDRRRGELGRPARRRRMR